MKLLLYCTKAKPYLWNNKASKEYMEEQGIEEPSFVVSKDITYSFECDLLNSKIVAECDFEVEHIWCELFLRETPYGMKPEYKYYTETSDDITKECCLTYEQMDNYLQKKDISYAIHIKNLHIFDEPRELNEYYTKKSYKDINKMFTDELMIDGEWYRPIYKAPQNMMYSWLFTDKWNRYVLISIQPQWLCKILNGEKTIEVRKKVLKEML